MAGSQTTFKVKGIPLFLPSLFYQNLPEPGLICKHGILPQIRISSQKEVQP
jgi:hypothetical protein